MGMSHDDDVSDLQALNGKLQRGRHAMREAGRRVRRHQIGDIAHDEQFAGMRIENDFGRNPRVAATNDHDLGPLAGFGEFLIAATLERQAVLDERAITIGQPRRQSHADTLVLVLRACSVMLRSREARRERVG